MSARSLCIACVIHQPRPEDVALFSRLVVVSRGRTIYCGQAGAELEAFWAALFDGAQMPPLAFAVDRVVSLEPPPASPEDAPPKGPAAEAAIQKSRSVTSGAAMRRPPWPKSDAGDLRSSS